MTSSDTSKREFTVAQRYAELNRALRRPRRVLWAYCHRHDGGYYFFDVRIQTWNPGEQDRWEDNPDMKKVRGLCMWCGERSIFFVGRDELTDHKYNPLDLCQCGLPEYHKTPSREFMIEYNAVGVSCRPNMNGNAIAG